MKTYLHTLLTKQKVPHLLLFIGDNLLQDAVDFAKKVLGSHSLRDIHVIKVEGKAGMHSMQAMKDVLEVAHLSPFEANGKVIIIDDAERMLATSCNALLKTIEEPPPRTYFILLSAHLEKVLGTIRSRAQIVRFQRTPTQIDSRFLPFLEVLQQEKVAFLDLAKAVDSLQKQFDASRKQLEKDLSATVQESLKEMNTTQRQKVEDDIEGQISSDYQLQVRGLLGAIGTIYRQKCPDQIESIVEALDTAILSIERSSPLKHVLESLILRIEASHAIRTH